MIPYARQSISEEDIEAVVRVLRSDFLTQGAEGEKFEGAVSGYCGAGHAVAVSSATAALHLACLAMGLSPGDWLWTSPITFVASANCARYCGASVDFVDVDPVSGNISIASLEEKLVKAEREGCLPKVVVPVHLAGFPCDLREMRALADRYGFLILEDASHALGADYLGGKIGNGAYSDATVFSFHAVKMITSGEGGMVMTNRSDWAERIRDLRTHGITKDSSKFTETSHGPWYYQQIELGMHYRLTDMQAALGTSQMQRLPEFLERRRFMADRYDELLGDVPVKTPVRLADRLSSWHLYMIQVDFGGAPFAQKRFYEAMRSEGVGIQLHYIPVHLQPDYARQGFQKGDFPNAEALYSRAVSLPMFFGLREEDQDKVCDKLKAVLQA